MTRTRLYVLDLGRLRMRSTVLIGQKPSPFADIIEAPVSAYCIDHPDGRVLFDAGCHPDAMGPNGRWPMDFQQEFTHLGGEECALPHRLEQLGFGVDDLRYVVLSHMHADHAGCVEFFRKSQLIVHADELAAVVAAHKANDQTNYAWRDTDAWIQTDLNWRTVSRNEGNLSLHDEVQILNFGRGHSFGMLGLSVRLPASGEVLLVSDAAYCAENLHRPPMMPGFFEDEAGFKATLDTIRHRQHLGADIWFGHDPRQFAGLRKSTDGAYE